MTSDLVCLWPNKVLNGPVTRYACGRALGRGACPVGIRPKSAYCPVQLNSLYVRP